METIFQDLRYGVRQLLRSPGFAGVAIATLALGVGAVGLLFAGPARDEGRPPGDFAL